MRKSNNSGFMLLVVAIVSLVVGGTLTSVFSGGSSVVSGNGGDITAAVTRVIEENPQLIVDAFQKGRLREQQQEQEKAQENIAAYREKLEKNDGAPFIGNPKADVVVVEFFDYSCGFCKRVIGDVAKLVEDDKNVKFVFKEFPILGPGSEIASRAALAVFVERPEKYFAFHRALMEFQGQKTEQVVLDAAKKLGLDAAKIKAGMNSAKVSELLVANQELGRNVGVNGTPAFVIGGRLLPGALGLADMKAAVEAARKK